MTVIACCTREPRREAIERHRELVSVDHLDVDVELCHPQREPVWVVGTQLDMARGLVDHLDIDRDVDLAATLAAGACTSTRARYFQAPLLMRPTTYSTTLSSGITRGRNRAPVGACGTMRSTRKTRQSSRSRSHASRYQSAPQLTSRCGSVWRASSSPVGLRVPEPEPFVAADRASDRAENREIERRPSPWNNARRLAYRLHAPTQTRGQHLLQLRERGERCLFDSEPLGRDRTQSDRDGDGLVVVEQQWGHRRPGGQPVPARDAGARIHGIPERPQLADVGAHSPRAHVEPAGELGARPVALELEQRQQFEQTGRGLQHVLDHSSNCGS